jgi:nucleoside-diphosphate-sugar epimerase/predicted dehydrogenase
MSDITRPSTGQTPAGTGVAYASRTRGAVAMRRVALLGAGYIADWHAKSIALLQNVELVAVCDRSLTRSKTLAGNFCAAHVYGSLEEMLAAETLDAVHILVPPDHHFEAARTILDAGVNVFLEQPMCDRPVDCETLVRIAEARHLRLGVGHNFLFAEPYERLWHDVHSGVLGRIDHVTITWNRFLPQAVHGPFDIWMLRDPRNIMIEIGSHSVAHLLDLVGEPEKIDVRAGNPIEMPTGRRFYRRWQVNAVRGHTAVELRFSYVPGFAEYTIHVRGSQAAGTVDFERNTYTLNRYRPCNPDFENYAMVSSLARSLKQQARRTLSNYVLSKLHIRSRGTTYGWSIARAMDAFYNDENLDVRGAQLVNERIAASFGAKVIRLCVGMGALANLPPEAFAPKPIAAPAKLVAAARVLVLGGTGFIGKELVRQLIDAGRGVRLLVRNSASLPESVRSAVEFQAGDVMNKDNLRRAMQGVDCVFHLARANVKSWADYQEFEIGATRQVAECALEAGVKRLIYTGTIDSYYAGGGAGTINENTPLDAKIAHRNLYAQAKAASEEMLMGMHRDNGLSVTIVRPGIVIGRGGSPFHWGVGMWWHDSVCQIWGDGKNKLPLVLVGDVARGLIAAMEKPGIEGRSFNLVGDPCMSAQEYLDELDRAGKMQIQRHVTPILKFYLADMMKWAVKVAVRHPERRLPSYRDWESRTQRAFFDCTAAKTALGWQPTSERGEVVRRGIEEPLMEFMK